jgi:hypothetical protein
MSKTMIRRRGMTLPELLVGTTVTVLVVGAASTLISAVGSGWTHSQRDAAVEKAGSRSGATFQKLLSNSLAVMRAENGGTTAPSYLFYWKYDGLNGTPDGKAQAGEMAMIEYNPANKTVWLLDPPALAGMTADQQTIARNETWSDLRSAAAAAAFRDSGLAVPVPMIGPGNAPDEKSTTIEEIRFGSFIPTGGNPIAAYKMTLDRDGVIQNAAGSVVIRSPALPTNVRSN